MFTYDDVRQCLETIVEELPDRVNPTDGEYGSCVYTDPQNPEMHCIAGEVAVRLGLPLPDVNDPANWEATVITLCKERDELNKHGGLWYGLLDAGAISLLGEAQFSADYKHPWKVAYELAMTE